MVSSVESAYAYGPALIEGASQGHKIAGVFKNVYMMSFQLGGLEKLSARFSWQERCRHLLDEIHAQYFSKKAYLEQNERLDFIEITLGKLVTALCDELKPEYANMACKFSIDRTPSLFALFYADHLIKSKQIDGLTERKQLLSMLLSPPIFSNNRAPHDKRIERLSSALERLLARSK